MSRSEIPGIENGVYVVLERAYNAGSDVPLGVALHLEAARDIVLDAAGFSMLVPAEDGDGHTSVPVESANTEGARECFRWVDEKVYPKFKLGEGEMRAYFQDEASGFVVLWTELRG